MAEKIIGVYKIVNTITGDFYIGSSKNVKSRWTDHKCPSVWKKCPNNQMYQDFQKYGVDKFDFEILAEVEEGQLKEAEQQFIEKMHPTYNSNRAKGLDVEKQKERKKEYYQHNREDIKKYQKDYQKEHYKQNREKYKKEYNKKYQNQPCLYNGEKLTFNTLACRFRRAGIKNPTLEAKKYIDQSQR